MKIFIKASKIKARADELLSKRKALVSAFFSIALLVSINVTIIFRDGWTLPGFPHPYLYTALQKYYNAIAINPKAPGHNSIWDLYSNDNMHSPLYQISTLFARIGDPSPPWLRLSGVVLLSFIFAVSYLLFPAPTSSNDRLIIAITVATTPIVFFVTRYLEDFGIHILILLLGSAILFHSHMGRITLRALPFYLLPALDFLLTHAITNFFITMMSFLGIYLYSVFVRIKDFKFISFIKLEIPRLLLAALALIIVNGIRIPGGITEILEYYRVEAIAFEPTKYGAQLAPWFIHALAYPAVLLFSSAGIILCAIALLNLKWKFRSPHVWMYLLWISIPLIVLTPISKKNTYYVWTLTPAISLLAAEVVLKLPNKMKKLWITACFVFAGLHLVNFASPLEQFADLPVFQGHYLMNNIQNERGFVEEDFITAREAIKLAERCGDIRNESLVIVQPPVISPAKLYFAMLYFDQRPVYWFPRNLEATEPFIAVEILECEERDRPKMWEMWNYILGSDYLDKLRSSRVLVYESKKYRVYCPREREI